MTRCFVMCIMLSLALVHGTVLGQIVLIDDFNDGDDSGWTRYDYTQGEPWGPGTFDASSGSYHLETQGTVTQSMSGQLTAVWDASQNPVYSNGFLRVTVRSEASQSNPFVLLRSGPGASDPFYAFGGDTATGQFFIDGDAGLNFFGGQTPLQFLQGEDWVLEAGVVEKLGGVELSLKVWKPGEPIPGDPQLTVFDSTPLPANTFQVGTWVPRVGSRSSATFDDIYFTPVPEPASGCIYLLVGLLWGIRRR